MANHYAGQEVCSCTYDVQYFRDYPRLLAEFRANRVYDSTYADKSRLLPTTNDGSPFYTALNVSQDLKDTASPTWSGFAYPYYAHDSSTPIGHYSTSYVSYSRPEEVISIKKPPTREMTATLKAWLNEHKKNPYPTKAEKIMLAIITKMTLTQVSTWFANARRRLKKDNKVTWEVKNRTDNEDGEEERRETDEERRDAEDDRRDTEEEGIIDNSNHLCGASYSVNEEAKLKVNDDSSSNPSPKLEVSGKPRIWSLADTAMSPDTTMSDHGISTHFRPVQLRHLAANYSLNESAFERVGFATSMHLLPERDYAFSNVVASNLSENLS